MLMGGSAVGISYVLANKFSLSGLASKWIIWWKLVSIPVALIVAWQLLHFRFGWFGLTALIYLLVYLGFRGRIEPRGQDSTKGLASDPKSVQKIEHELENCC